MFCSVMFFCYQASNILGGHGCQFNLHLSRQDITKNITKNPRDRRIRWCHLSTIPSTTPHCLVSTEGGVNF